MSNEEIVQEIQNGINVTENVELLYRQNMPLIRRFIKPYSHYENMEDLEQESYFGLFEATKNYDPNKEAKFITYARFWIVQAVSRYIQCNTPAVRIPSGLNGKINRYKKYVSKYVQEHGSEPDTRQIGEALGCTDAQIRLIQMYSSSVTSLDAEVLCNDEGEGKRLLDTIPDDNTDVERGSIENAYNRQMQKDIRYAVDTFLGDREKKVIEETFFHGKTLRAAGETIGVTGERTRAIQAAALRRLRIRGRKLLLQYAELNASIYRGTNENFKQHNSSIVEHIAITKQDLQREYEDRVREAMGV